MTWLERAVATGYNDVDAMKTGKDLGASRDRADFEELLAALGTKQKKEKKFEQHLGDRRLDFAL